MALYEVTSHPQPPDCRSIEQAVKQELEKPELQGLTSVVMVGGFSGSIHLQVGGASCLTFILVAIPTADDAKC